MLGVREGERIKERMAHIVLSLLIKCNHMLSIALYSWTKAHSEHI